MRWRSQWNTHCMDLQKKARERERGEMKNKWLYFNRKKEKKKQVFVSLVLAPFLSWQTLSCLSTILIKYHHVHIWKTNIILTQIITSFCPQFKYASFIIFSTIHVYPIRVRFPFKPEFFQSFFRYSLSSLNNCDELKNHNTILTLIHFMSFNI